MEEGVSTKIDIQFAEAKVIFLISDCSLHKHYGFWNITKEQAEILIRRLKLIEQLTWNQFSNLDRAKGLTCEIPGTPSFEMIHEQNSSAQKLMEQHYFHFRVRDGELFRVFGYQKNQYFCITQLDMNGKVHH